MNASTAPPTVVLDSELSGAALNSGSEKRRRSPVNAIDSGRYILVVPYSIAVPVRLSSEMRRPASPSGAPELRCGGRAAAAAASMVSPLVLITFVARSCSERENSWPGRPGISHVAGK